MFRQEEKPGWTDFIGRDSFAAMSGWARCEVTTYIDDISTDHSTSDESGIRVLPCVLASVDILYRNTPTSSVILRLVRECSLTFSDILSLSLDFLTGGKLPQPRRVRTSSHFSSY